MGERGFWDVNLGGMMDCELKGAIARVVIDLDALLDGYLHSHVQWLI